MNNKGLGLKLTSLVVIAGLVIIILGMVVLSNLIQVPESSGRLADQRVLPVTLEIAATLPATEALPTIPNPSETPVELPTFTPAVWSALHPVSNTRLGLLTNGSRSDYRVALTFDLCQSEGDLAGYDAGVIHVLTENQAPATLFLGGLWMRDHQTETLGLASNPLFELGNHSWSHKDFSSITREEMQQEILLTQQFMFDLLGYQTNVFRLPFGTYNEQALNVINEQGLYIIQWDDVSGDPDPNVTAEGMTSWVLQQLQPGSIIIMHANGRGWHTAEALPGIIRAIREQGYTLVTVSELLGLEPYK